MAQEPPSFMRLSYGSFLFAHEYVIVHGRHSVNIKTLVPSITFVEQCHYVCMCAEAAFSKQQTDGRWKKIVSEAQPMVGEIRLNQSPLFVYAYIFRNDHSQGADVTTTRFHHLCLPLSGFQPWEFLLARDFLRVFLRVSSPVTSIPLPPQLFCFFPLPDVCSERIVSDGMACNRRRRGTALRRIVFVGSSSFRP